MDNILPPNFIDKYHCEVCDHTSKRLFDFNKHKTTKRHIGKCTDNILSPEKSKTVFGCEKCVYYTKKNCEFIKHCNTNRHKKKIANIEKKEEPICCYCGIKYSANSNLIKHKKICKQKPSEEQDEIDENKNSETKKYSSCFPVTQETFLEFMKQSQEFQNILVQQNEEHKKQIIELTKAVSVTNNITNSNNNSNNNQFNIQVFLNDHCKDAINIMDFVDSLKVQVSDLEKTGEIGYVNGITRILVNGLRKLDVCKRPIHCTDIKRETLYIKDQNTWEKENTDKPKLKKAVNRVSQLNLKQLKPWQEQNPEYENLTSKVNDIFIKLSTSAIGSCSSEEDDKNTDKIMKNVLKEVVIEKREPTIPLQPLP